MAGVTAAALLLPKAMAFATIAGLPVQVGLYTCLLPMVMYAFSGSSRVLSVSTTTLAILLSAHRHGGGAGGSLPAARQLENEFRWALIDLEDSALKMLREAEATLRREGIHLWLAGLNPSVLAVVRYEVLPPPPPQPDEGGGATDGGAGKNSQQCWRRPS
ncbi:MAG: SulP family inorganic anion transporter [Prochlorococcaceae cyanobacterium]